MKTNFLAVLALTLTAAGPSFATAIYDSTTGVDSGTTYIFSSGPFSQIGDSITLAGTARLLNSATVRFYNLGDSGTFDATLRFWDVDSPVGLQRGSDYTVNVTLNSFETLDVTFFALNLLVPNNLVFTIGISNLVNLNVDNVDPGLIALTADPLTNIGSSNVSTLITRIGAQPFAESPAAPGAAEGNPFLLLDASEVPEPATLGITAAAALLLFVARRQNTPIRLN